MPEQARRRTGDVCDGWSCLPIGRATTGKAATSAGQGLSHVLLGSVWPAPEQLAFIAARPLQHPGITNPPPQRRAPRLPCPLPQPLRPAPTTAADRRNAPEADELGVAAPSAVTLRRAALPHSRCSLSPALPTAPAQPITTAALRPFAPPAHMSVDPPQKRQRQTGSFSPASPPYHLAAKTAEPAKTTLHQQPDTPTSPPYMSSTAPTNSHASTASLSSASGQAVTPPSSANMSQASQPPNTNSFPTPASSAGTVSFAFKGEDGDVRMTDDAMEGAAHSATRDVAMGDDGDHRHTGHDRTGTGSSASGLGTESRLQPGSGPFYKLSETRKLPELVHVLCFAK